ncbi:hypothetical protein SAMN04490190_4418 [Pseudomonas libanensis]|uniref:hypothetical protein n=1 Tax=Pseudomonas libanensis TaxID=75588 RepID=UPI00087C6D70|nr:hypothetical protein [Pseudomonas libanensis]SDL30583.1 hypothetical protein SAMN04490190_4418 [Pseudomonas libanensis]
MNTSPPRHSSIKLPLIKIFISILPIFVLAALIPAQPSTPFSVALNNFLDNHLLGVVGAWSSHLPLPAKAIANYISIAGPIIGIFVLLSTIKNSTLAKINLKDITWPKYALMCAGLIVVNALFAYQNYFSYIDFAAHDHKLRLVGNSLFLLPIFTSALLLALYGLILFNYLTFFIISRALLQQKTTR